MKNNNQAIVRKLTNRTLKANKNRNFFITTAIALTAFMMTSVFSIGAGWIASVNIMPFRSEGIHSHMGFAFPTDEQMETLRGLDYVRHYGIGYYVGTADIAGMEMSMMYTCRDMWDNLQTPTFTRLVGSYATAENEIMLSRAKLREMGITDPYAGMEIPLDFTIHGTEERHTKVFTLSAFYTEFVSAQAGNAFTPMFVSQAFAQRHGRIYNESMNVNVLFRNANRATAYAERLVRDLGLVDGQHALHPGLIFTQGVNYITTAVVIGSIIVFLMLTGFLLIYNVMYVSVSKDVRFYGLLKTLGTTPRQLRRLVNGQLLLLYLPGMAVGLGFAALASFAVVPVFMRGVPTGAVVSFSPWIYVGGAVFALFTALLGARAPAKKAAGVSPVEAVQYAGEIPARVKARVSAKGKPLRMAWRNVFRERKRAVVVLAGLFIGIAMFAFIMTSVYSMDIDSHLNAAHPNDFAISTSQAGELGDGFAAQVAAIDGVTGVYAKTMGFAMITEPHMGANLVGFDTGFLLSFAPDTGIDLAAFERGEIALVYQPWWMDASRHVHLPAMFDIVIHDTDISVRVTNGGAIPRIRPHAGMGWSWGGTVDIIMSNVFLQQVVDFNVINLVVNIIPGTDEAVNAELNAILGQFRSSTSRLDARRAAEDERLMTMVLGSGISFILALIGIFNFINVMSVGLLVRRREFAALESVGMSKKQLRTLVLGEGVIYWLLTVGLSVTLGTAVTYGLLSLFIMEGSAMFHTITYPVLPIVLVFMVILAICLVVPVLAHRGINKLSLVERLREAE